jgi:hypothetical protein
MRTASFKSCRQGLAVFVQSTAAAEDFSLLVLLLLCIAGLAGGCWRATANWQLTQQQKRYATAAQRQHGACSGRSTDRRWFRVSEKKVFYARRVVLRQRMRSYPTAPYPDILSLTVAAVLFMPHLSIITVIFVITQLPAGLAGRWRSKSLTTIWKLRLPSQTRLS